MMLVLLSIAVACTFFYVQHRKLDHISCNAFYIAKNEEARLVSKNHIELDDGVGSWLMNGRIKIINQEYYYFNLRAQFSVKRIGNVYYLTTNNVMFNPNELSKSEIVKTFLANILRIEKAQSFFTIKNINDNYIILSGDVPLMYCMKTKS